jgi:hypothetical protein
LPQFDEGRSKVFDDQPQPFGRINDMRLSAAWPDDVGEAIAFPADFADEETKPVVGEYLDDLTIAVRPARFPLGRRGDLWQTHLPTSPACKRYESM